MKLGEPVDRRLPWVRKIHDLDAAWAERTPGARSRELTRHGATLGDSLREGPRAVSVRTLPLSSLIYPTKFAFNSTNPLPFPFIEMIHRALLVQVRVGSSVKNVLFNPTDVIAAQKTPFLQRIIDSVGERTAERLRKKYPTIEEQLAKHGLGPADIDLIAYDHFHTQDLRSVLGSDSPDGERGELKARFPNALLLAPSREWHDWDDLHPMQRVWFVADGKRGVPTNRVILTDADVVIGDGAMILRTPGHTTGNQTLFVHADGGVFGCSENGCSADNWTPHESRLPGLARYARRYDADVILNANTPELGGQQYCSMLLERSVVDRVPDAPGFVQMFPSSEVTPSVIAPGIRPSMVFRKRESGTVVTRRGDGARADVSASAG